MRKDVIYCNYKKRREKTIMKRGRPPVANPKTEVMQIRVTKDEKEMLYRVREVYDFESVAEMIITLVHIKDETSKRKTE